MVNLAHLAKTYPGGVQALTDVSLTVAAGERVVIVGPSGSGKTTLLRLVAGLEEPTAGTVTLAGHDFTTEPPAARRVAMVFQSAALYPYLTVRGNLAFGLRRQGLTAAEIDQRIRATAERLGLTAVLHVRPDRLSGGQQQRVALGRALVRRPVLFLFDEPLSHLDAGLRRDLRQEIARLQRETGTPLLFVTHDQAEALALADRLAVLHAGRIAQVGPPLAVYRRPANRFVAGFLGDPPMNFLEGALRAEAGALVFAAPGLPPLPVAGAQRTALQPFAGQAVVLGFRPEALQPRPAGASDIVWRGTVRTVEALGDRTLIAVELATGTSAAARLEGGARPEEGSGIALALASEGCHWFAPGPDGQALA